jgi:hypothetical protein
VPNGDIEQFHSITSSAVEGNERRNVCQQHFVPILVQRSRKRDHRKTVQYCSAARPFPIYFVLGARP